MPTSWIVAFIYPGNSLLFTYSHVQQGEHFIPHSNCGRAPFLIAHFRNTD